MHDDTRWLHRAAAAWLAVALLGQWAFFAYIAAFYGPTTLSGDFEAWNRLEALGAHPFRAGDTAGNATFLAHALGAGLVALGGALQLIPWVRRTAPRFHRWNGRVFLLTVCVLSLSGFYLVWVRDETPPRTFNEFATSANGVLILAFAALAYRNARARDFVRHREWALRLYLVSNAQWFTRVGIFGYLVASVAVGHTPSFKDPFISFWAWGCFLVPLLVLEAWLRACRSPRRAPKYAVAGGLAVLTVLMAAGIVAFGAFSRMIVAGGPLGFPG